MHAPMHTHACTHTHTHTHRGQPARRIRRLGERSVCWEWTTEQSLSLVWWLSSLFLVWCLSSLFLVWWLSTVCLLCGVWSESVFYVVAESVFYVVFEQSLFLVWCLSTVCFNCHLVKEVYVERGPENRVCLLCGVWAQSVSTASRHQQWMMASRRRRCTCVSPLRGLTCSCCPPCTPLVSSDWSATSPAPPATCCTTVTHTHSSRFVSQQSVKSTDLTGLVSPFPGDGTFNIVSLKKYFIHFGHCFAFETVFFFSFVQNL